MEYLFPLVARREIAQETMEFSFDPGDQEYSYKGGQHTDYTVINPPKTDDEGNIRTFSFVSAPGEKLIRIATRMRSTAFKDWLKEMPFGTKVQLKEPMGRFTLHQDTSKPAVFLVGGIGITPFMSMIADSFNRQSGHTMYLLYSNNTLETTAYFEELQKWEAEHENFHFIPTFTKTPPENWRGETGRVTEELVKKHVDNYESAVVYSAGPPAMVSAMVALAEKLGITDELIKTEDFDGY